MYKDGDPRITKKEVDDRVIAPIKKGLEHINLFMPDLEKCQGIAPDTDRAKAVMDAWKKVQGELQETLVAIGILRQELEA